MSLLSQLIKMCFVMLFFFGLAVTEACLFRPPPPRPPPRPPPPPPAISGDPQLLPVFEEMDRQVGFVIVNLEGAVDSGSHLIPSYRL